MDTSSLTESFGSALAGLTLSTALRALVMLLIGLALVRVLLRLCARLLDRSKSLSPLRAQFLSGLRVLLYLLLALVVLGSLGVEMTSFIALLSVAGLAISLALQTTLSNIAGGVTLLVSKPFTLGDYIEFGDTSGTVAVIGLSHSTLTTPDNKVIHVPNSELCSARITNYNALGRRRIDLSYSTEYDAPTPAVKAALFDAAAAFHQIEDDPAPAVYLTEYGKSSITYLLRFWVKSEDYWDVYYGVQEKVCETFARRGVKMTYEHLNVHVIQ